MMTTEHQASGRMARRIELAANVAILVVSCILVLVLLNTFVLKSPKDSASLKDSSSLKVGQRLDAVAGIDRSKDKTVILALSTSCRFCIDSAPFYRKLTMHLAGKTSIGIVAMFPQSKSEAGEYLKQMEISISNFQQMALRDLGVPGTPTVILIDQHNVVTGVWVGRLKPEQEADLLSKL